MGDSSRDRVVKKCTRLFSEGVDALSPCPQDSSGGAESHSKGPNKPTCYDSLLGTGGRVDRLVWYHEAFSRSASDECSEDVPLVCGHSLCPRAKMDTDSVSHSPAGEFLAACSAGGRPCNVVIKSYPGIHG